MSAIITAAQLEALDACEDQLAEFRRIFPDGTAKVTVSRAKKLAQIFQWSWAAENLLTDRKALEAYVAACASALTAYKAATASARVAFEAVCASAQADYEAATASALAVYVAATVSTWADYEAACAEAFARAYIMQEKAK